MTTTSPAPSAGLLARLVAAAAMVGVCAVLAFCLAVPALLTCFGGCTSTDVAIGWLMAGGAVAALACGPLAAGKVLGVRASWSWLAAGVFVSGVVGWVCLRFAGS